MSQRTLIIGPAWVGDMVMAQSLFKLLKQREPHITIDVLAPTWTVSLLERMPEVSQALALPLTHGDIRLDTRYQLAKQLRAKDYHHAIVLPNSFKSALIPWLAGIPKRTGWRGEFRYILLNDIRRLDKTRYPRMVEQFVALGLPAHEPLPKAIPYPAFQISQQAKQAALEKYQPLSRGKPLLALCPGAEYGPSKRWPADYFAQVANAKIKEGWDVWLLGSKKDSPIADHIMIMTENRCENLVGRTDLAETIDLLSLVSGVVTNDSGLMHIAAALNKPLVALYGSTSPLFTPPLSADANILQLKLDCQPCFKRTCPLNHHRCMHDLYPNQVLATMSKWS